MTAIETFALQVQCRLLRNSALGMRWLVAARCIGRNNGVDKEKTGESGRHVWITSDRTRMGNIAASSAVEIRREGSGRIRGNCDKQRRFQRFQPENEDRLKYKANFRGKVARQPHLRG